MWSRLTTHTFTKVACRRWPQRGPTSMKFGKELREKALVRWRAYYVDYKMLKQVGWLFTPRPGNPGTRFLLLPAGLFSASAALLFAWSYRVKFGRKRLARAGGVANLLPWRDRSSNAASTSSWACPSKEPKVTRLRTSFTVSPASWQPSGWSWLVLSVIC